MLLSQAGTSMSPTNSQVKNGANNVGIYESLGAAASTSTGTLAASTDAWYANGAGWGDAQAGVGIGGTSNALGSTSNLYVAWMNSLTSAKAGSTAGFTQLTANGLNVVAFTHAVGADTYLTIAQAPVAAVPEADTSAMMLAGLGLMGFIARRRNRKQA